MTTSTLNLTQEQENWLLSQPKSVSQSILKEMAKRRGISSTEPQTYQERQRTGDLQRKNKANRAARDVGEIPDIENPRQREEAKWDLRHDIETYHAEKVYLGWCADHLRLMREIQYAILETSQVAVAMTRGSGKTSLMRLGVEWAIRHGHRVWPMLINAESDLYKKQVRAFKSTFKHKLNLAADFPETVWVFQQMSTSQSAANMTCRGEPMEMVVTTEELVSPTNYMSLELGTAGRVISGGGITGSVRGAQYTLPSGDIIRPDCVLLDDFQTRESANSVKQVKDRVDTVSADVMGCAGPGVPMSALLACTVIANNDAADQILSSEHPEWRSIRCKWIVKWPKNMELWGQYGSLLRRLKANESDLEELNTFYLENRECHYGLGWHKPGLDYGSEVYWEARIGNHIVPKAVSSLQTAMSWWLLNPDAFMAEAQNSPIDPHEPADVIYCSRTQIKEKLSSLSRLECPDDATELVSFIDIQLEMLIYCVMAVTPDFQRYVVDVATFPDQKQEYWTKSSINNKLSDIWSSNKEAWLNGLIRLTGMLTNTEWKKPNGQRMHISRGCIDASWGVSTDSVFQFCRDWGNGIWYPSYGVGIGPSNNEINYGSEQKAWRKRHTDWGPHWQRKPDHDRGHEYYRYDANFFKSSVHLGISTPEQEPGSLQLFQHDHELIADHLRAEYPDQQKGKGREVVVWLERATRPDNDLFDCITGCGMVASSRKIVIPGMQHFTSKPKRRRRTFGRSDLRT